MIELGTVTLGPERIEVDVGSPAQVQEACHVADGRVEPDVKVLAGLVRDLEAEVGRISGDVPIAQAGLEPFVELAYEGRLDMFGHPCPQLLFEIAELKEEVLGLAHGGLGARNDGNRIQKIHGRVRCPAVLTGVAVLIRGLADRARAADVSIRQEHIALVVVRLLDRSARDMTGVQQPPIHLGRELAVLVRVRGQVVVDTDMKALEVLPVTLSDLLHQRIRCDAG